LAELLETEGFAVLLAETGTQAEAILTENAPDLALLDIRLPGLDGLSVLRHARERGSDAALIIMTAHGDSSTAIEAMKAGAFDYVLKPIDFRLLLQQIERALQHRRLLREQKHSAPGPKETSAAAAIVGQSPVMQHI
jgi:DNA-binding NtrC family response regulator